MSQSSKQSGNAPRANTNEAEAGSRSEAENRTDYGGSLGTAKQKNANLGLLVSTAVSVALLGGLFYFADFSKFLTEIEKVNLWYLPPLAMLGLLSLYIRGLRWRYLLPSSARVTNTQLFDATLFGTFASSVLPLRAGEFIRPWVLSRAKEVSFATGFASIVTERVFDVLALLVLLAASLGQMNDVPVLVSAGAKALGAIAALIVVVMVIAYVKSSLIIQFLEKVLRRLVKDHRHELREKIVVLAEEFLLGLRGISSFSQLILVFVWSLILWVELGFIYQVGLWAMGETANFWVGLLTSILVAFAVAAPSAPGFIGTFQAGCVVALTGIYHYPHEFALAYAIFIHGAQFGTIIVAALILLNLRGLSFSDLKSHSAG